MTPPIAPAAKMRRARASVRREHGGYLGDAPSRKRRLDNHLACEFHAWRTQPQSQSRRAINATQATMEVTNARGKEQAPGEAQQRVAQIAMQQWHGARPYAATKAMADHHRIAGAQVIDE